MSTSRNKWQQLSLGSLLESIKAGTSTGGEDRRVGENEYGVLTLSSIVSGVFDPTQHKAVALNRVPKLKTSVRAETIIISRSNTINLVGASAYIDKDYPNLFLSDLLWELKPKESSELIPQWLGYALASPKIRLELQRRASGTSGSMKKLSMARLRSVILEVPPIHIQKLTCLLLKKLDFTIKIKNDLIVAKRSLKQGLMQQLLTGKRRFPEFEKSKQRQDAPIGSIPRDWQLVKIEEIAKEISEKGAPEGTTVLSCTKYNGLVASLEYFERQIFSQNLDTYKVVKRKQFAYATNHIEEGSIGLLRDLDVGLVSPMYTVFETSDKVENEFLFALLKTESYRRIFESLTSASVDRRGSLRWNIFSKILIGLPLLLEQQKIVSVLLILDKEISLLEKQLNLLKLQKRGLMQKLLTGEIQVLISDENVA